jgi:ABC-type Zn uptake system ZnuABC Zn-binding protein ZnuA
VLVWVDNIEKALIQADPVHSADYQKNAEAYRQQLRELDAWVSKQVNQVPQERRKLVTDHLVFTYFARRYGFEQVGAVVPGYSTMAAPSAQELAALENAVRELGVPVIFVGNTVNPSLSERVTQDTNTRLVYILTGSLGDQGKTYIEYMRHNVAVMVEGLK